MNGLVTLLEPFLLSEIQSFSGPNQRQSPFQLSSPSAYQLLHPEPKRIQNIDKSQGIAYQSCSKWSGLKISHLINFIKISSSSFFSSISLLTMRSLLYFSKLLYSWFFHMP